MKIYTVATWNIHGGLKQEAFTSEASADYHALFWCQRQWEKHCQDDHWGDVKFPDTWREAYSELIRMSDMEDRLALQMYEFGTLAPDLEPYIDLTGKQMVFTYPKEFSETAGHAAHSGQLVTVTGKGDDFEVHTAEGDPLWNIKASDGWTGTAWASELDEPDEASEAVRHEDEPTIMPVNPHRAEQAAAAKARYQSMLERNKALYRQMTLIDRRKWDDEDELEEVTQVIAYADGCSVRIDHTYSDFDCDGQGETYGEHEAPQISLTNAEARKLRDWLSEYFDTLDAQGD